LIRAALSRAPGVRILLSLLLVAGTLALGGCFGPDSYEIPSRAMKELSPEMVALLQKKDMPKDSPILIRLFKEESELEVWKEDSSGRYALLKVYPICRWSGQIGPKVKEGDRQAPEGFYPITPGLMNPNSSYYLAINTGFPNAFDRANNRHGAFLMIHGDCSSRGCYAMTDEEIGEIYSLARDAFLGGQKEFQLQAYPFRMTPANLARHRNNPNMPFWRMIKEGNDIFEVSHSEPKIDVCGRNYVFDAVPAGASTRPLVFRPTEACPRYELDPTVAQAVHEKEHHDDEIYAALVKRNVPEAPLVTATDGGMNRVFVAKLDNATYTYDNEGHIHVPPQQPGRPPPAISPPRGSESDTTAAIAEPPSEAGHSAGGFFTGLFASRSSSEEAAPSGSSEHPGLLGRMFGSHGSASASAAPAPETERTATRTARPRSRSVQHETASIAEAKANTKPEAHKPVPNNAEPQQSAAAKPRPNVQAAQARPEQQTEPAQAKPEQQANAFAASAPNGGLINGAQPVVPAGSFNSRWAGFQ
jgi:murein L,D-transpeptidase YafK